MTLISVTEVQEVLRTVPDPLSGKDILAAGLVSDVQADGAGITVVLSIDYANRARQQGLRELCEQALRRQFKTSVRVILTAERLPEGGGPAPAARAQWNLTPLENVRRIIAVASGKGGVGKSTVAAGLSMALAAQGKRVGLLDADIQGPSLPRMMGLSGKPEAENGVFLPKKAHGVACMSLGFLIGDEPAVMRGPMVSKTLYQLLRGTRWGTLSEPLDTLFIDLPPGTGDIHLSLLQQVPLHEAGGGALIVTTPQDVAVDDAWKCIRMFQKIETPILGIIENMSFFALPDGSTLPVFGTGGGERLAEKAKAAFLGKIPLDPKLSEALDKGLGITAERGLGYFSEILKKAGG